MSPETELILVKAWFAAFAACAAAACAWIAVKFLHALAC